jgi:sialic acid synthase SpsE
MTKSKISVDGNSPLEQGSCRVIAEAGVNHNNSIERAIQMAVEAKKAGAWAVKYQLYKAGTLAVQNSPKYWTDSLDTSTQFDAFSASDHLDYGQYKEVSEECKRIGMAVVGLEVPHVHVHLIPLQDMDDMRFQRKTSLTPEEFQELATKIANNI